MSFLCRFHIFFKSVFIMLFSLMHQPEDAEYLSEDNTVVDNDRIHRVVLRLQPYVTVFFIESLDSSTVFH